MLHDQTFNLDQVAFATKGIKDAEQTISAPKSANKELKGMMKIVNSSDVDSMQDKMMDLSTEILESSGRSYDVANDIDEEELVGGMLDALESDMGAEMESDAIPSYLQPDTETDLDAKLNLLQLQQAMLRQCPTERGSTFYTQLKEYCSQNGKAHTHDNHNVLHIYRTYIMGIWTYIYSSIAFKKDKENPTVTSPSGPTAPPPPPPVEDGGKQTGPSRSPMIPLEIRQPGAEAVVAASPEIPCGRPALVPRLMGLEDLPALTVAVTPEATGAAAGSGEVRRGPQDPEADHRGHPLGGDPREGGLLLRREGRSNRTAWMQGTSAAASSRVPSESSTRHRRLVIGQKRSPIGRHQPTLLTGCRNVRYVA
ncbi:Charged multivesicular body protein [Musa troglodytarum]|uniref:Charged multivesicular body protein n=1 Tax=Musa troglodytarum TaxID=320322 RepID=A0A9E7LEL9_9LILI|nr:Charged multivesicular body protein [Musa troglodytarum]